MESPPPSPSDQQHIAIIGAGFGGIASAIALKNRGFENFTIYEKASDVGGTWRDNVYPGCTSDISIHYYSLSTDLKHDWDRTVAYQPSILGYIQALVKKYNLASHLVFNSKVISADWDSSSQGYTITIENTSSGARGTLLANIVISAHGPLHVPKYPDIPGLKDFQGRIMHSAQWDKSLDLRGKRVAVIGNGSSGTQIVSRIAYTEGVELTQFIRTQNWMLPAMSRSIHRSWQWAFKHIPLLQRFYRYTIFWISEFNFLMMFKSTLMRKPLMMVAKNLLLTQAPKEYHRLLVPSFPVGCRRVVFEDRYLPSLHLPNVSLRNGTDIASVGPDGMVMKSGEKAPFDVIICATGFTTDTFPFPVRGVDSTIQEFYTKSDGPNAYLGTTVPGFPNYFQLMGPNTATGYTSVLFFIENQLGYIMQLIKPVIERRALSVDVTPEANDAYNSKLQTMFKDSVFTFCGSWYRVRGNGRNVMVFPGSAITFWWWCRSVTWSHYKVVGNDGIQMTNIVKLGSQPRSTTIAYAMVPFVVVALGYLLMALQLQTN